MIKNNKSFSFTSTKLVAVAIISAIIFSILPVVIGAYGGHAFGGNTLVAGPGIFLNEVNVDTPNPASEECEYIEIKGPASTQAPNNLFFLSIDGDSGQFGIVTYLGNLTGVSFGSNGTITIISNSDICAGRTYPAGTTVLEVNSIALGFGGETFLLATSTNPTQIFEGQDLDVNNDGVLDASFGLTPVDGVGWVLSGSFNVVYGGSPILVDSGNTDLPDATTRFEASITAFDAASWYYGELAGPSGNSTVYTAPLSPNFPACGLLTPGAPNTPNCGGTPTATATNTPTTVPSNSPTSTATDTATPTSTPTNTPTATATNSFTPTSTPTGAGTPSIAGTVTYGNPASPTTKFISNAQVTSTVGSPVVTDNTDAPGGTAGQYTLTGFGAGNYTIGVTKTTGQNGISSADAARIAQHVSAVSVIPTSRQRIAADVTNNGALSSTDAAQIARFVSGLGPPIGITNTWRFFVPSVTEPTFPIGASPTTRSYTDPIGVQTGQDYIGILVGEVTGNWAAGPLRPAAGPERSTAIAAPRLVTPADSEVIIPVAINGAVNKGIISYEFDLRYDPTVIQPQAEPVDLAGTVSRGLTAVANPNEPGLLRVVMYGAYPIDSNGLLLNLKFTAVGAPGSTSPLTWENVMFNEGDPGTLTTDGAIELSASAPNQAELTGRVVNTMGQGIANARVTLTDTTTGAIRSAMSNGFGVYRFGGLTVGQTYTISVDSKHSTFAPLTVSITNHSVGVDMIVQQ
ncbi:MAG: carboxypeptidase regulatory-like domain-containing protein [Chloracidobacterium sp.]|nr:carboxypeptidase regulatory-like domain-containing protein [Chloracidobacterium sp.]